MHIYTHNASEGPELSRTGNIAGPCDEDLHSGTVAGLSDQSNQVLHWFYTKEKILQKLNKLSVWPTFGLGLDLTNWIMARSSFYNVDSWQRQADKKFKVGTATQYKMSN